MSVKTYKILHGPCSHKMGVGGGEIGRRKILYSFCQVVAGHSLNGGVPNWRSSEQEETRKTILV